MDRNGCVTQHGLWPSRGDRYERRFASLGGDKWVTKMPKIAFDGFGKNFVVADRRLQIRIPIHQSLSAINETLGKQIEERGANRLGAHFVQGESCPSPIARTSHALQLAKNSLFVLFLPLPNTLNQFLAPKVMTRRVLNFF